MYSSLYIGAVYDVVDDAAGSGSSQPLFALSCFVVLLGTLLHLLLPAGATLFDAETYVTGNQPGPEYVVWSLNLGPYSSACLQMRCAVNRGNVTRINYGFRSRAHRLDGGGYHRL